MRIRIPWVEDGRLVIDGVEYDIVASHAEIAPEHWHALADTSAEPAPLDSATESPAEAPAPRPGGASSRAKRKS